MLFAYIVSFFYHKRITRMMDFIRSDPLHNFSFFFGFRKIYINFLLLQMKFPLGFIFQMLHSFHFLLQNDKKNDAFIRNDPLRLWAFLFGIRKICLKLLLFLKMKIALFFFFWCYSHTYFFKYYKNCDNDDFY